MPDVLHGARANGEPQRPGRRLQADELLNGEIFYTLREAQVLIEKWRKHYNTIRPHSALGYRPPAPEAMLTLVFLARKRI